jgi:hypothetical protein
MGVQTGGAIFFRVCGLICTGGLSVHFVGLAEAAKDGRKGNPIMVVRSVCAARDTRAKR